MHDQMLQDVTAVRDGRVHALADPDWEYTPPGDAVV
jgi:ABC-type Fe3+-hydroxamate transport system substrate-binding protein